MKFHFSKIIALAFGIILSLGPLSAAASVELTSSLSSPILPQIKTETSENGGDDESSSIESAGEISYDENICTRGLPSQIKNEASPSGDFEGLLMIRWEKRTLTEDWQLIPSATVLTYSPTEIFETTQYRRGCRESIHDPWVYSNVVTKSIVQGIDEVKITSSNVTCKGGSNGSAGSTIIGGSPGYEYEWSTPGSDNSDIYGLTAGFYSLTVTDANGCTYTTENFEITEPEKSVQINYVYPLEPKCPGEASGAIFVDAFDGVPPYTYLWSNGIEDPVNYDIPSGSYNVTVKDALGCTHTVNGIALGEPDPFVLSDISSPVSCFGDSDGETQLDMTGGTGPYEYFWQDGYWNKNRSDLEAGTYEIIVQDINGCISYQEVEITTPDPINPEAITLDNKVCKASISMIPTGGEAPYSYEWNDGQTTASKNNLCPGLYTVLITDANGCQKEETLEIRAEYAIKSIDIEVLLNPFHKEGNIVIHLPYDKPADIEVYSTSGQLIETFSSRLPQENKEINVRLDLDKYSNGIYLVNVRSAGLSGTEKIVISARE